MNAAIFFQLHRRWSLIIMMMAITLLPLLERQVGAHQVPSLTVEALFSADRSYILRISLDPRLFLSDQPASLPPVPIEWYREQNETELATTRQKAADYLKRALTLKFAEKLSPVENCEYQPMDGATNLPLADDTKEVHLLATMKGKVPDGVRSFAVALSQDANVSMILMNSFEGTMERRPNVIFPGETTRPYTLAYSSSSKDAPAKADANAAPARQAEGTVSDRVQSEAQSKSELIAAALVVFAAVLLMFALRARGRRSSR